MRSGPSRTKKSHAFGRAEAPRPAGRDRDADAESDRIYGILPVTEALRADRRRVEKVLLDEGVAGARISEIIDLCKSRSVRFERIPRAKLGKFFPSGVNHQGVSAITASSAYSPADEILESLDRGSLVLLLDGVEDPRNLGAILRTAECSGVDGVFLPERRAVGLTDTVAKSSAGALEHVKVAKVTNLNRLIEDLKARGIWIVGTSVDTQTPYTDWDWTLPTALILGSEGHGLHQLVARNCDALVRIPMYGKIDSLNVSVAAGVILFEARRQRTVRGD